MSSLLSDPNSMNDQDRRVLTDVKANASKEGLYLVNYSYGCGSTVGRVYTGGKGYLGCTAKISTKCSSRYYAEDDLDNSFPTIINQVFQQTGCKTPCLTTYINQREQLFQDFTNSSLSRKELNQLFLISLFLGDYLSQNDFTPIHFLSSFQRDTRQCQVSAQKPTLCHDPCTGGPKANQTLSAQRYPGCAKLKRAR